MLKLLCYKKKEIVNFSISLKSVFTVPAYNLNYFLATFFLPFQLAYGMKTTITQALPMHISSLCLVRALP